MITFVKVLTIHKECFSSFKNTANVFLLGNLSNLQNSHPYNPEGKCATPSTISMLGKQMVKKIPAIFYVLKKNLLDLLIILTFTFLQLSTGIIYFHSFCIGIY